MLSAETEGGQRKCHPYWIPDSYGPMKLKAISERKVALGAPSSSNLTPNNFKSPLLTPQPERSTPRRPRATTTMNPLGASQDTPKDGANPETEVPYVVVRTLALSHALYPFQPMREITQLHYSNWPDFGAPAHPADLLGLVEQTNAVVRKYNGTSSSELHLPAKPDERPIIVHCSAGCGRTGTFCTVDSVIDMLKRQRMVQKAPKKIDEGDEMEIDAEEWLYSDENDLVAKAVEDFRHQRLSMVQTLRQYVLCYETVLEWLVKEMPEKYRRETLRRSYGG
jgi:tyrosine-protein phosphatase 2/3